MDTINHSLFRLYIELTAFSVFDIFENLYFIDWIIYWFKVVEMERDSSTENDMSNVSNNETKLKHPSHMIWWFNVGFISDQTYTRSTFACQRKYTYQTTLACHCTFYCFDSVAIYTNQKHFCYSNRNGNVSDSFHRTMSRTKKRPIHIRCRICFNWNFVVRSSLMQLHKLTIYRTFAIWILHCNAMRCQTRSRPFVCRDLINYNFHCFAKMPIFEHSWSFIG